jgi:hypothetical protein
LVTEVGEQGLGLLPLALGCRGGEQRLRLLWAGTLHVPTHHPLSKGINLFTSLCMRMQQQGHAGVGPGKIF